MKKIYEDAPANNVGGGEIAGLGVDKEGVPGSGEPGKYVGKRKRKHTPILIAMLKRLQGNGKPLRQIIKG